MMKKKGIGIALGVALALGVSGMALATPTKMATVDGITWNTASPLNLKIQGIDLRETSVAGVGDTLTGYGEIGSINGATDFCSGCDLNFTFTYTVKSIVDNQIVFEGGTLNLYADSTGKFDETDPSTAGVGTLWLSLTGHTAKYQNFATTGTLFSNVTGSVARPGSQSGGFGFLDVSGGDAESYVMRNVYADGLNGFADFELSSSFSFQDAGICGMIHGSDANLCFPIAGTGTLLNQMLPVAVPEPAELGLLGLGLGVLGFLVRRHRKEGKDRA